MSTVRALVIRSENGARPEATDIDPTHAVFCALVGDVNTDTIFSGDGATMVKVAANGKNTSAALNSAATRLVEHLLPGFAARDRVVGVAVVVGLSATGDPADVSDDVVGLAQTLLGS